MVETPDLEKKIEMTRDAIAERVPIARVLGELAEQPGWQLLHEQHERAREKFERDLLATLMSGGEVDQRWLDEQRGFFKGVGQLLEAPEKAMQLLERAIERLQKLESRIDERE